MALEKRLGRSLLGDGPKEAKLGSESRSLQQHKPLCEDGLEWVKELYLCECSELAALHCTGLPDWSMFLQEVAAERCTTAVPTDQCNLSARCLLSPTSVRSELQEREFKLSRMPGQVSSSDIFLEEYRAVCAAIDMIKEDSAKAVRGRTTRDVGQYRAKGGTQDTAKDVGQYRAKGGTQDTAKDVEQYRAKGGTQDTAKDVGQYRAKGGTQDTAKDVGQYRAKGGIQDTAKDVGQYRAKGGTQDTAKDVGQYRAKGGTQDTVKDVGQYRAKGGTQDTTKDVGQYRAKGGTQDTTKDVGQYRAKGGTQDTARDVKWDTTEDVRRETAETVRLDTANNVRQVIAKDVTPVSLGGNKKIVSLGGNKKIVSLGGNKKIVSLLGPCREDLVAPAGLINKSTPTSSPTLAKTWQETVPARTNNSGLLDFPVGFSQQNRKPHFQQLLAENRHSETEGHCPPSASNHRKDTGKYLGCQTGARAAARSGSSRAKKAPVEVARKCQPRQMDSFKYKNISLSTHIHPPTGQLQPFLWSNNTDSRHTESKGCSRQSAGSRQATDLLCGTPCPDYGCVSQSMEVRTQCDHQKVLGLAQASLSVLESHCDRQKVSQTDKHLLESKAQFWGACEEQWNLQDEESEDWDVSTKHHLDHYVSDLFCQILDSESTGVF